MANTLFRNRASASIRNAAGEFANAMALDHAGLRGRVRELAVERLFAPFLPGAFEFGTGKIVDARDAQSAETDLIIYSRHVLPPILYSQRDGVFPVEASFYAIEVKSRVTAQELDDVIAKMRRLRTLRFTSGEYDAADVAVDHQVHAVVPALFAFSTDLTPDGDEFRRYTERDLEWQTLPALRAICVLGRGYWRPSLAGWLFHEPTPDGDEVIEFLSGIANTLPGALASRRRPRIGQYLIQPVRRSRPVDVA